MIHRFAILTVSVLLLSAAAPLQGAGAASMLADLDPSESRIPYDAGVLSELVPAGGGVVFIARSSSSGRQLWASDGTPSGTLALLDFCSGSCVSKGLVLGTLGKMAFFVLGSDSSDEPTRFVRTDGTRAGTVVLGWVLGSRREGEGPLPCGTETATLGGTFYFFGYQGSGGSCGLWRTDGTPAGTRRVRDGFGIGSLEGLSVLGDRLYFSASDGESPALWRSDGTEAGTEIVRHLRSGAKRLTAVGSRLFFIAHEDGQEVWTSDGTAAGTRPLTSFTPPSPFSPDPFRPDLFRFFHGLGGVLYFVADDVTGGVDLWRSDGTPAGTRRVTDFGYGFPFPSGFDQDQVVQLGTQLFFVATDGLTGYRIWTSGGTPATTAPLAVCPQGACLTLALPTAPLVKQGNRILFPGSHPSRGIAVWSTDGSAAGTRTVQEVCSGEDCQAIVGFEPVAGRVLFVLHLEDDDGIESYVLWQTDGTDQGTRRLASFRTSPFTYESQIDPVAVGGRILFPAEGESSSRQLWATDGTPEGTAQTSRIGRNGYGSDPTRFVSDGRGVWFETENNGAWRSEGTAATTVPADSAPSVIAGGLGFYIGWDGEESEGLWRSDGSRGGTLLLTPPGSGRFLALAAFRDRAAFVLQRPDGAVLLGESDGTPAGTRTLFELPPHFGDGLREMLALGPELFFLGQDGNTSDAFFWRSNGTPAGTYEVDLGEVRFLRSDPVRVGSRIFFVADKAGDGERLWKLEDPDGPPELLLRAELPDYAGAEPSNLIGHQGSLYFMARSGSGRGLWRSDGTTAGTVLLATFVSSYQSQNAWFAPLGDRLCFAVDDGVHGIELWRTDGTPAGTVLVRDIRPGPTSSSPRSLTAAGGRLLFSANDGVEGFELWESDGTAAGTRMVQDIAPGVPSSDPRELTEAGGKLFFSADDGEHGREPWVLDLAASGCRTTEEALCLGGRFRVEATWRDFEDRRGRGRAVALTADTGYFWFFDPANVEVVLKVLDGSGFNGHHWVFYGALSSVEYALTVTDTWTGATRRYVNPSGRLASIADTRAFGPSAAGNSNQTSRPAFRASAGPLVRTGQAAGACAPSPTRLCLQGGRFAVEARWKDFQGKTGAGQAVPLSGDTGYFWFFGADNVEVVLKVLDGRPLNGRHWVFYGALSSVEYTLTVTDTETGKVRTYTNPSGRLASVADTAAF